MIQINEVLSQLLGVLRETFEGPQQSWSYFTDAGPEAGYFGTLRKITAIDASRTEGGSSIAGHIHHVVFALNESSAWIRGDRLPRDWKESWSIVTVNDPEWSLLIDRLQNEYTDLLDAVQTKSGQSIESMGGAIGALAHSAFHLGALRQKVWQLRKTGQSG